MRLPFLALILLVVGCDRLHESATQFLGYQEQAVILAAQPFELGTQARTFTSQESMSNLGMSSVCVALKERPMGPVGQMDRDYESSLKGAKLSATLVDQDGKEYRIESVGQAWRRKGVVVSGEELSACISCACGSDVPKDAVIKSVRIQSDKPVSVLGAYWHSIPEIEAPKP